MSARTALAGIALMLAAVAPSLANAADEEFKHEGPYLQVGTGLVSVNHGSTADLLDAKLGVDIVEYLAIETQLSWVPENDHLITTFQQRFSPLSGHWQPNFILGIGLVHEDGEDSEFLGRFGGGLDYVFTETVAVSLDVAYLVIQSLPDRTVASLGVRFGF